MQPTIADKNFNPGNLKDPSTGQFRQFSSEGEGYSALMNDLQGKVTGTSTTGLNGNSTLHDFANTYAPPSDNNNSAQYTVNLANKMGVRPDTKLSELKNRIPDFAQAVASNEGYGGAKNFKSSQQSISPDTTTPTETPQNDSGKDFMQKAGDVVNSIFPGKQIGEAIGTLGGYGLTAAQEALGMVPKGTTAAYDTSAPTPLQVAGDVAQGAITVGAGLPGKTVGILGKSVPIMKTAETALGRIGQGALIGGGVGSTNAVAKGQTDINEITKQGLIGGAIGGATGGAGELINKAAQSLPQRIVRSFVPGVNQETAQYAVGKGLGSPKTMLEDSGTSIKTLGTKLGQTLDDAKYTGMTINGNDIIKDVMNQYPQAGLTAEDIWGQIKKLTTLKSSLVDKLQNGVPLTLKEAHSLNSTLGRNTFKNVFDDPAVKAGKDIGSAVYHSISSNLTQVAPETKPLFDQLSKEYPLQKALQQVIRRGEKAKTFNLRDLMAIIAGFSTAGPVGAGVALGGEHVLTSPTVNLNVAGLLNKVGNTGVANTLGGMISKQATTE
jgi:hypothetical protein